MFWLWALLLAGIASVFVLLPLILPGRFQSAVASREKVNVGLYVEYLAELEVAQAQGRITAQEYAQLKVEMQENLLQDTVPLATHFSESTSKNTLGTTVGTALGTTAASAHKSTFVRSAKKPGILPLLFAALLLPLVAVFIFADFGMGRGSVSDVILLARLSAIWSQEASPQQPANPHHATDHRQLVEQLAARLSSQPENVEGQFLLARSWRSLQEPAKAVAIYEQLRQHFPQDLTLATHYAEALFAADGQQMTDRVTAAIFAAQQLTSDTGRVVMVLVEMGANLAVPDDAVVFVYARAWEGPSVPLAVQKLRVAELPRLVRLDESMAMVPGLGLAEYTQVQLVARISATGSAEASDDDYEARSPRIELNKNQAVVKLLIEHKHRNTPAP